MRIARPSTHTQCRPQDRASTTVKASAVPACCLPDTFKKKTHAHTPLHGSCQVTKKKQEQAGSHHPTRHTLPLLHAAHQARPPKEGRQQGTTRPSCQTHTKAAARTAESRVGVWGSQQASDSGGRGSTWHAQWLLCHTSTCKSQRYLALLVYRVQTHKCCGLSGAAQQMESFKAKQCCAWTALGRGRGPGLAKKAAGQHTLKTPAQGITRPS